MSTNSTSTSTTPTGSTSRSSSSTRYTSSERSTKESSSTSLSRKSSKFYTPEAYEGLKHSIVCSPQSYDFIRETGYDEKSSSRDIRYNEEISKYDGEYIWFTPKRVKKPIQNEHEYIWFDTRKCKEGCA